MGTIASRHAYQIIQNVRRVLAIELICAMQAVEIRGIDQMGRHTKMLYEKGRELVPSIKQDRVFSKDIEKAAEWLKTIEFQKLIRDLRMEKG
jgi:histidine ammonia-lyase